MERQCSKRNVAENPWTRNNIKKKYDNLTPFVMFLCLKQLCYNIALRLLLFVQPRLSSAKYDGQEDFATAMSSISIF